MERSGAVAHKTALEYLELIIQMARPYRDDEIARVLSKLGRRTGKGNRWSQARVAYVRQKYAIDPPDETTRDEGILNLEQATQHMELRSPALATWSSMRERSNASSAEGCSGTWRRRR